MQDNRRQNRLLGINISLICLFFLLYDYWVLYAAWQQPSNLAGRHFFWAEETVRILLGMAAWGCFLIVSKRQAGKLWLGFYFCCCLYITASSVLAILI